MSNSIKNSNIEQITISAYYKLFETYAGNCLYNPRLLNRKGSHPFFDDALQRKTTLLRSVFYCETDFESFSLEIHPDNTRETFEIQICDGYGVATLPEGYTVLIHFTLDKAFYELLVIKHNFSEENELKEHFKNGKLDAEISNFLDKYKADDKSSNNLKCQFSGDDNISISAYVDGLKSPYGENPWLINPEALKILPFILITSKVICREVWTAFLDKKDEEVLMDVEDAIAFCKGAISSYIKRREELFDDLDWTKGYLSSTIDHITKMKDRIDIDRRSEKLEFLTMTVCAIEKILGEIEK